MMRKYHALSAICIATLMTIPRLGHATEQPQSATQVVMLGTGTPIPSPERFGPSTLIEAGDQKLLIDAGRGAAIRLHQLRVPLGRLDALLLTHYHSDHTSGIPDVCVSSWPTVIDPHRAFVGGR